MVEPNHGDSRRVGGGRKYLINQDDNGSEGGSVEDSRRWFGMN